MARAAKTCSTPGCPEITQHGRCLAHARQADRARGSAHQRGYGHRHRTGFREAVLARDPICVLCLRAPSAHADHHPLSRRELLRRGLDPNDAKRGRGLCRSCHSAETAQHQPGGWHAE